MAPDSGGHADGSDAPVSRRAEDEPSSAGREPTRRSVLVVNARSRRGRELFREAAECLEAHGVALAAKHRVTHPHRLRTIVEDELARGARRIIVGGGDGTVGAVAGVLAHRDVELGLLPLGTGNNFATRTLGIPATVDGAAGVIAAGKSVAVDLGEVNGHYFVNSASIGLTSDVALATPAKLKRHLGVVAYAITGLRLLISQPRFRCTIALPGRRETIRTHLVVVANGSHFGVARVAPEVLVESGELLVFTIETSTRWRTLRSWARFLAGRRRAIQDAHRFVTRHVTIDATPGQLVDVDGEVRTRTPARIAVAAKALKVLAPPERAERRQKRTPTPA